ncbi:uncharacterized protein LOC128034567 [Gossypium raimondii]|uniref:uncharacterized protein LOC128034567 n=1 Tax=Gossypium raimondii TaxID=29730 RepID=UPI00227AB9FE|nr:uncharacterized protein LOC128034567 [Gossypium raimondii]
MHPGSGTMYYVLRWIYWWPELKRDVTDFVARCLVCKKVKAEHQFPSGLMQPIAIPEWKWEKISMNFVSGLPLTLSRKDWGSEIYFKVLEKFARGFGIEAYFHFQVSICMALFEALYGRKFRTPLCWTELDERRVVGLDSVYEIEWKVSPWKRVLIFGWKGKLCPRYIGPYEVVEKVGSIAYHLKLPPELERIHDVFHVSMLQKYRSKSSHIVPVEEIAIRDDLSYEEEPIEILAREEKVLRNKRLPLVKVLWRNHKIEEATWEIDEVF